MSMLTWSLAILQVKVFLHIYTINPIQPHSQMESKYVNVSAKIFYWRHTYFVASGNKVEPLAYMTILAC